MMRVLMIGSAVLALAAPKPAPPVYCDATVQRVQWGVTVERVRIRPAPTCPPGGVVRARKRSLLNAESPYIPIYPLTGAWEIPAGSSRLEWVGVWPKPWIVERWTGREWTPARRIP